jgi:hypothetical protein
MSQSDSPESSVPPPHRSEKTSEPPAQPALPAAADLDAERDWTVGDDGVVDEPGDHSRPSFDDELDPTDAP